MGRHNACMAVALACVLSAPGAGIAAGYGAGCCTSIVPELPPATPYGGLLARIDDPVNEYQPHVHNPLDPEGWTDYLEDALEADAGFGPYSTQQAIELSRQGAAYQEQARYTSAIEAYTRAVHLLRVNEGLETPLQVPLLQQIIESLLAQDRVVEADNYQNYLFRIQRENLRPTDPEMLHAVEQYADWHRNAYISELDKDRYARILDMIDLYSDMADAVIAEQGEHSLAALPYLRGKLKAQYLMSIYPGESEASVSVELYQQDNVELPTLKKMRFMRFRDFNYRYGEQNLEQMRDIIARDPASGPRELADATVALGDWYQWHHRYAIAQNTYREAWEMMAGEADAEAWQRQTFGVPLELPREVVFQPGRLAIPVPHTHEVQLRFSVSTHGEARDIEVLRPEAEQDADTVNRGHRFLRDIRFRPRMAQGDVVASNLVERSYVIRY